LYFHPRNGDFADHADHLFSTIVPDILARTGISPGQAAVLYPAAWIGDAVADAARRRGFEVSRSDTNALYPRGSTLMRWLESCAVWCCGGWRSGSPRYALLSSDAQRIFTESLTDAERRVEFDRRLIGGLWNRRDPAMPVHEWLEGLSADVLNTEFGRCRRLDDEERAILRAFLTRAREGTSPGLTLAQFAGFGDGANRITLSSLHSAKGREFEAVVLFGMNNGRIPRANAGDGERREARRSCYVGVTRAQQELHMMYSGGNPSPFATEVRNRLNE
jgi:DNA helicase-2/ATP-dependent DNA helicase PcrA